MPEAVGPRPIQNRIGQVFVPVSNIRLSASWYCALLDQPVGDLSHEDSIYDVPMEGETRLCLDASRFPVENSSVPLFFFWADDIGLARDHLVELGIDLVSGITDIGTVQFLMFRDPDENLLMVCVPNPELSTEG